MADLREQAGHGDMLSTVRPALQRAGRFVGFIATRMKDDQVNRVAA